MPPKAKFTREEIFRVAFEMTRKHGIEFISARSLAAELGVSTAPIFTAFESLDELDRAIIDKAKEQYGVYLKEGMKEELPFRGTGLAYIRFAKEEPKLFSLLFMGDGNGEKPTHYFPGDEHSSEILNMVMARYQMTENGAKRLYNHLSVYAHGLASLFAMGRCVFTMEDAGNMLSELFFALTKEKNEK
ncbi:MAG: TetR/AcrR family transcriptional regulator [Clostridia bacterium]|nr:TetR/AcrR family transcriptional regulator [Clostridia bacterium]